jgi:cytochrome c-type protein NapB
MNKIVKILTFSVMLTPTLFANTASCKGCHGENFEKKVMGTSKILKDMSKKEIIDALKGYKDGTYGGKLKKMMVGRVVKLSDKDIKALANEIKK